MDPVSIGAFNVTLSTPVSITSGNRTKTVYDALRPVCVMMDVDASNLYIQGKIEYIGTFDNDNNCTLFENVSPAAVNESTLKQELMSNDTKLMFKGGHLASSMIQDISGNMVTFLRNSFGSKIAEPHENGGRHRQTMNAFVDASGHSLDWLYDLTMYGRVYVRVMHGTPYAGSTPIDQIWTAVISPGIKAYDNIDDGPKQIVEAYNATTDSYIINQSVLDSIGIPDLYVQQVVDISATQEPNTNTFSASLYHLQYTIDFNLDHGVVYLPFQITNAAELSTEFRNTGVVYHGMEKMRLTEANALWPPMSILSGHYEVFDIQANNSMSLGQLQVPYAINIIQAVEGKREGPSTLIPIGARLFDVICKYLSGGDHSFQATNVSTYEQLLGKQISETIMKELNNPDHTATILNNVVKIDGSYDFNITGVTSFFNMQGRQLKFDVDLTFIILSINVYIRHTITDTVSIILNLK